MNDITRDIVLGGGRTIPDFYCPSEFWPALGYEGTGRFVAIWWEPGGDEACYADGRQMLVGAEWGAYQALVDHNFPWPSRPQLGDSETPARYWLVIDRHNPSDAWLVPAGVANDILRDQWPVEDVAADDAGVLSFEELEKLIRDFSRPQPVNMEEIERQMQESAQNYETLVDALRACPRG